MNLIVGFLFFSADRKLFSIPFLEKLNIISYLTNVQVIFLAKLQEVNPVVYGHCEKQFHLQKQISLIMFCEKQLHSETDLLEI